jgi:RNA polymerase sigma-70 factor (ECF subfamily)
MKTCQQLNQPKPGLGSNIDSEDSFEQLYRRYAGQVFRTCLAITKNNESAQDCTQDVFLKVFEKRDSFQHRSSFSTWLYAIAHNHCLTQLKKDGRRKTEPVTEEHITHIPVQESPDRIEAQWQAQETALNQLPTDEVSLLRLKYEKGLSIQQISQDFNLSESAVKMRLKRSRDRLRTCYS